MSRCRNSRAPSTAHLRHCTSSFEFLFAPGTMTSTQYDSIGNRYKAFKERAVVDIEEPSVLKRLGGVDGLSVLDLACGLGIWSRLFVSKGASKVVGVDISSNMIEEARAATPTDQAGRLTFEVGDC